ncbi:MAG: DUF11 domain-containing protein [Oscillospiraceae bacterium]|nr:DUF11 domain-containing protein [Oscillospiraceae bacterium]
MNRFYTAEEYNNYNGYDNDYSNGGNTNGNNGGANGNGMNCRFTNTATAQGYLEATGSGNPTMVNGEGSVTLNCIFADIEKTADRESVAAGDRIRYTITFRNMSDREMYNVKITDNGSRYINPIATTIMPAPRPGESLESGITIGRVPANSERTLTYTAVVTDDASEDIVNRAFADFSFRGGDGREQTASTHITSLTIPLENNGITVTKTADKTYITSRGETVTFTITVHNNSSRVLHDLVVSDKLPNGMSYVEKSTYIGNNPAIDADPADGIYIGTLAAGGDAVVKFSAKVDTE